MVAIPEQSPESAKESSATPTASSDRVSAPSEPDPAAQLRDAMKDLKTYFAEMTEYAQYLVSLQLDRGILLAKKLAFFAVAGVLGLMALVTFLAAGVCLLTLGVAGWIGQAFNSFWIGATLVGFLMLLIPAVGLWFSWSYLNRKAYAALRAKYEARRKQQKEDFGRDVKEVASA